MIPAPFRPVGLLLAALTGALFAPLSHASSTWALNNCSQVNNAQVNNYGNSFSCTAASAPTITASAWSTTGGASNTDLETARLVNYGAGSGFGVSSRDEGLNPSSPNHALDNATNTDLLLLNFAQSVALNSITIGWPDDTYDTDLSVLRYTGGAAPVMGGKTLSGLLSSGWELVGHYANLDSDTPKAVNGANNTSSWWLISAYNTGYGGNTSATGLSSGNDYVKVLSVAATVPTNRTPEPGSLALAALALVGGAVGAKRRHRS